MFLSQTLHSVATIGLMAGVFLWNTSEPTEVYLGTGPAIKVKHNDPSPAQAALEDSLTISNSVASSELDRVSKKESLVAGKTFNFQKSRTLQKRVTAPTIDFGLYRPRPTVRVARADVNRWIRSMDEAKRFRELASLQAQNDKQQDVAEEIKEVETSQGTPIVVSRIVEPAPETKPNEKRKRIALPMQRPEPPKHKRKPPPRFADNSDRGPRDVVRLVHPTEVDWGDQGLRLLGHLLIVDGLAYNPDEHVLTMVHEIDGYEIESAEIKIESAEFFIAISEAVGSLVVEMRTVSGELVGEGQLALADLPLMEQNTDTIDQIVVKVKPKLETFAGEVISAYSYKGHRIPLADAKVSMDPFSKPLTVNEQGRFADGDYHSGSTAILTAQLDEHWSVIQKAITGKDQRLTMFSDKTIKTIYESLFGEIHSEDLKTFAVIKGTVLNKGKGVAGASIQLEGEFVQPVYFEYFLPQASLQQTTENGEFIMFVKTDGPRYIRAEKDGLSYPAQWVPVKPGHITEVVFDLDYTKAMTVEVFNGVSGDGLSGWLRYTGVTEDISVDDGVAGVMVSGNQEFLEMDVDMGEEYPITRFEFSNKSQIQKWPMLKTEQIETLLDRPLSGTCPVIGWVDGSFADYSVVIDGEPVNVNADQITYFDAGGNKMDEPVDGGGFILNLDIEKMVHLQVIPKQGSKIHNRTFLRDPKTCQSFVF